MSRGFNASDYLEFPKNTVTRRPTPREVFECASAAPASRWRKSSRALPETLVRIAFSRAWLDDYEFAAMALSSSGSAACMCLPSREGGASGKESYTPEPSPCALFYAPRHQIVNLRRGFSYRNVDEMVTFKGEDRGFVVLKYHHHFVHIDLDSLA